MVYQYKILYKVQKPKMLQQELLQVKTNLNTPLQFLMTYTGFQ